MPLFDADDYEQAMLTRYEDAPATVELSRWQQPEWRRVIKFRDMIERHDGVPVLCGHATELQNYAVRLPWLRPQAVIYVTDPLPLPTSLAYARWLWKRRNEGMNMDEATMHDVTSHRTNKDWWQYDHARAQNVIRGYDHWEDIAIQAWDAEQIWSRAGCDYMRAQLQQVMGWSMPPVCDQMHDMYISTQRRLVGWDQPLEVPVWQPRLYERVDIKVQPLPEAEQPQTRVAEQSPFRTGREWRQSQPKRQPDVVAEAASPEPPQWPREPDPVHTGWLWRTPQP